MKNLVNLFFFSLCLLPKNINGQANLVRNPSFEDTLQCVLGDSQFRGYISNWRGCCGEYYNSNCQGYLVEVPSNGFGYQYPRTENAYAGIYCTIVDNVPEHENARDYVEGELSTSLIAGKNYCVSFYVNQPDLERYSTSIGYYFSTDTLVFTQYWLNLQPNYMDTSLTVLRDSINWTLVSDTFLANGGENYITIGNFWNDTLAPLLVANPNATSGAYDASYYYIDDVSVIDCGWSGISSLENPYEIYLFPNPSNGNFEISGNFPTRSQLHIYNLLGEEICPPINLSEGNQKISVELKLVSGIYFYKIIAEDKVLHEGKIVIAN